MLTIVEARATSDDFLGPDGHFEIWARLPPDAMVVRGQIIGREEI